MSKQDNRIPLASAFASAFANAANSGDFERDFKSRIVLGIALTAVLLGLPLMAVDVFNREWPLVVLVACGELFMFAVIALIVRFRKIQLAADILICTLLTMMVVLLFVREGVTLGFYVGLPTIMFLANILARQRLALAVLAACTLLLIGAAYLSATLWQVQIDLTDPVIATGGVRIGIVALLFTFITMAIFRRSSNTMREELSCAEINLSTANNALLDALGENITSVKMLMRLHEVGNVIGWWYDPVGGELHCTRSQSDQGALYAGAFQKITNNELRKLPEYSWQRKIIAYIDETYTPARCETEIQQNGNGEWSQEFCCGLDQQENYVWYRNAGQCEFQDGQLVRAVGVLHDISESKRLTDSLTHQASFDDLTGLLNRRSVQSLLSSFFDQAKLNEPRSGLAYSYVLFLDLDRFKLVNDISGHAAGDKLLAKIANLLKGQIRSDDVVGRLGGDEFVIILDNCEEGAAAAIAEAIRASIESLQFGWGSEKHRIGVSIGMVPIDPAIRDIEQLQHLADAACYTAKAEGRNRVRALRVEEGLQDSPAQEQKRWVQRLHDALDNDRFVLFGQKIVAAKPGSELEDKIEILLRLQDPSSDKLVPPGVFLPIAEHYGLAAKIDEWVVQKLIAELQASENIEAYDGSFWVNLSGNSLGDEKFAEFLIDAIDHCGLPKGTLNFEVTETALVQNLEKAVQLITTLQKKGCQFALDDFGSGQSSFGYLKKLPVNVVKIDGLFVKNILHDEIDAIFTRSIIDVAHAMGMRVVAEFVENREIANKVTQLGIDYLQGYGIHKPEPLVNLVAAGGVDELPAAANL